MVSFAKTTYGGTLPIFYREEAKRLPGGFTPVQSFTNGTFIRKGTLLEVDFDERTAAVIKVATALSGTTTTTVNVNKGLAFNVGDTISVVGDYTATVTITAIDTTTYSDYDVLTLSGEYSGLAEGSVIIEAASTTSDDTTTIAAAYTPNAVALEDKVIDGLGITSIGAAGEAWVLENHLPFPVLDDWKTGNRLTNNAGIYFITQ